MYEGPEPENYGVSQKRLERFATYGLRTMSIMDPLIPRWTRLSQRAFKGEAINEEELVLLAEDMKRLRKGYKLMDPKSTWKAHLISTGLYQSTEFNPRDRVVLSRSETFKEVNDKNYTIFIPKKAVHYTFKSIYVTAVCWFLLVGIVTTIEKIAG